MLRFEAIRMKNILSQGDQWRLERGAINQEVAGDLSNPLYVLGTKLTEKLFEDTPYAHDALGTTDSFRKTSAAMLKKFHCDWYAPNNAILVIVGDIDPPRTVETVKELFGNIPSRPLPIRPEVKLKPLKAAELKIATQGAYGVAIVAYRLPGIGDKDYAASQVLSAALTSPRGKLNELAAQGEMLTVFFESIDLPKASGGFATATVATGEDLHQKAALLKKVIAEYLIEGIPAELVEAVKHYAVTSAEAAKDSIPELAEEWSQALALNGYSSPDEELAAIRKVTVDDVNRVARTYLLNDSAITGLVESNTSGKPEVVATNFKRTSESFKAKSPKPVKLPAWAQSVLKMPIVADLTAPSADMRLANGMRLIVKPIGNSSRVILSGSIKHTPSYRHRRGKRGYPTCLTM
jgi:zinc protease